MTISYPLAMPTVISFATVGGTAENADSRDENPETLAIQIIAHPGKRLRYQFAYPPLKVDEFRKVWGFLLALDGMTGTFLFSDPYLATPSGANVGTPVVNGASETGKTLATRGWTSGITGILKAGDPFRLDGNFYVVVQDANSDGSGHATFDIWPTLRATPNDGDALTTTSAEITLRLDNPNIAWSWTKEGLYTISFSAVEAI